jgi:sugar lactone lactonase YvrE
MTNSTFKHFVVLGTTLFGFGAGALLGASAPTEITIQDEKPFPESVTSTSDGTLIIGGLNKGVVYRAARGAATAELWIKPDTNGLQRVLGVLADQKSDTLWVCSSKRPQGTAPTAVKTFVLKTGAPKGSYDFPGDTGLCNDIAIGPDGAAYLSDTTANRILRLKKDRTALEVWIKDDRLAGADGLAFGDNATLYVNTVTTGHLFRIPVGKDGTAGTIGEIKPSQPLSRPDGMRSLGKNQFLMIEGAGKLDYVTIDGDNAKIEVLKDGFNGPTAVTHVGNTAWVIEGKLNYMSDPKLKDQDPGPFKAYAVPFNNKR